MKIVQINHFSYKAAGNIMMNIHYNLLNRGIDSYVVWGRGRNAQNEREYYMNDPVAVYFHALYTRMTDRTGYASKRSTKKLVKWLKEIKPDIIHLHCIHGYFINIEELFNYIKEENIKVVWTQHDCWAFTGHCAYFEKEKCTKWKKGCENCTQSRTYPISYVDASKKNWYAKRELFTGLDMQIVTPCKWLEEHVGQSFLKGYPIEVIYNGVEPSVYQRTNRKYRAKYNLENKFIILGVASEWTERKGLKDFLSLFEILDKDLYQIVLVGLTPKQCNKIPKGIIGIQRTNNVQELVDLYSSADLFFNPSYEDNFPTTNIESRSCGTPIITYETGGCPEAIDYDNGIVVEQGKLEDVVNIIEDIFMNKRVFKMSWDERFTKDYMVDKYIKLYKKIME